MGSCRGLHRDDWSDDGDGGWGVMERGVGRKGIGYGVP